VSDPNYRTGAGVAVVTALGAAVVGSLLLGPIGIAAGLSVAGGIRNAYVSATTWQSPDPATRTEAGRAGVAALVDLALSGLLIHHVLSKRETRWHTTR
jgi:hypothetical protein